MQIHDEAQKPLIEWSDEAALVAQSASQFLAEHSGFEAVRKRMATPAGFDAALERQIAELGWPGIAVPARYGGAELSVAALTGVAEAMGQRLYASPFIGTTIAAQAILRAASEAQKSALLPKIVSGELSAALALYEPHGSYELSHVAARAERTSSGYTLSGTKTSALDAQHAELVLIAARSGSDLLLLAAPKTTLTARLRSETLVDETRRSARLALDGLTLPADALLGTGDATAALEHAQRVAWLLTAADAAGGAEAVMQLTLEYLRTRKQFGKTIGSYQALKHPMVEIMCLIEEGRSLLYRAATLFDQQGREREIALRMAKAQLTETYAHAADRAIQFHGGMGFTYECHAQLFLRRAQHDLHAFGDALHHRRHLRTLLFSAGT